MKILILAPHPFFQERGTPIAVDLLIKMLSNRGDIIDLLTFHEGEDIQYKNVAIHRIKPWVSITNIPPGLSLKKIFCDIFMFVQFVSLVRRNDYDVIHAVEESVFMALAVCPLISKPFVYDMDSSMATQIVDKYPFTRVFEGLLRWFESLPIRFAEIVLPVCDELAQQAIQNNAKKVVALKDVSLKVRVKDEEDVQDFRKEFGLNGPVLMYIGNLEAYQGIDLMIHSMKILSQRIDAISLIIIGGKIEDITHYQALAASLHIEDKIHFVGKRPVRHIGEYMQQADVLLSPRIHGVNTPMKIYSYLDSGTPVVATDLPTHTQVMSRDIAILADPDEQSFALAISNLLQNKLLAVELATNAQKYIGKEHSLEAYKIKLYDIYSDIEKNCVSE